MYSQKLLKVVGIQKLNYDHNWLYRASINFPVLEKKASKQHNYLSIPTIFKGNFVTLQGWVLGKKSPVTEIEINCGEAVLAKSKINLSRPDVISKFPEGKVNVDNQCGFILSCQLPDEITEVELDIYALIGSNHQRIHFAKLYFKQVPPLSNSGHVNNFFIIFNSRCGSTYLIDLLRNHPNIHAYMEQIYKYQSLEQQCSHINSLFGVQRREEIKAVGFKEQLVNIVEQEKTIGHMMENYSPVLYKMIRKNVVKTAISGIRAKQMKASKGVTNVWKDDQKIGSLSIPPKQLLDAIKNREDINYKLDCFLEKMGLKFKTIAYEDLLQNQKGVLDLIQEDLNLDKMVALESSVQKNTSDSLKQSISNFDDLLDSLSGTKYEEMLLEGS